MAASDNHGAVEVQMRIRLAARVGGPFLVPALFLALTAPVSAERGQASWYVPPSFDDLDYDRSGVLEPGEVQGRTPLYGVWERYDSNADGRIDASEFSAFEAVQEPSGGVPRSGPAPR